MSRKRQILIGAGIVLATLLAYTPAAVQVIWNGHLDRHALVVDGKLQVVPSWFIWDDDAHVTEAKSPTHDPWHGLERIWFHFGATPQYYPLANSAFWLEYRFFGQQPLGYHIVNILIHALSSLLVWRILRRLRVPGALLAAAVFALHPVEVESVAWITELKNILSGFFYLSAMLLYLRFSEPLHETPEIPLGAAAPASGVSKKQRQNAGGNKPPIINVPATPGGRDWRLYFAAAGLFVAALLTKTVTASLPAALLLILWWKRRKLRWADIWPVLPMLFVGGCMGQMTAWYEAHYVGAFGRDFAFTPMDRVCIAGRAVWFYAGKVFWPDNLMFFYPRWHIDGMALWQHYFPSNRFGRHPVLTAHDIYQYIFPLAAAGLVLALLLARRRLGKGPLIAVLFFGGTLFPALGFANVYPFIFSFVADHFQYLASLGLITLGAAALELARRRFLPDAAAAGRAGAVLLVLALGGLTFHRAMSFFDLKSLYGDTIQKNPLAWMAQNNLATVMIGENKLDDARKLLDASLATNPRNDRAFNNMAQLCTMQKRYDDAIHYYYESLKLNRYNSVTNRQMALLLIQRNKGPDMDNAVTFLENTLKLDPEDVGAANELVKVLVPRKQAPEAVAQLRKVVDRLPHSGAAHTAMAGALAAANRPAEAEAEYKKAVDAYQSQLDKDPGDYQAHSDLANILLTAGQTEEALPHFEHASQLRPDDAALHASYADVLTLVKKPDMAVDEYRKSLKIDPDNAKVLGNYANALTMLRQVRPALEIFRKSLKLDPANTEVRSNYAAVLGMANEPGLAAEQYLDVLKRKPDDANAHFNYGLLLAVQRRDADALAQFEMVLQAKATDTAALYQSALMLEHLGRAADAAERYRKALALEPDMPLAQGRLAWIYATAAEPGLRRPEQALSLALAACEKTQGAQPELLDALGAAYARMGQFSLAIPAAERALQFAAAMGREDLVEQVRDRIALYKSGQAYEEPGRP